MKESRKANKRRKYSYLFTDRVFDGKGIDIGCGNDILTKKVLKKIELVDTGYNYSMHDKDQSSKKYKAETFIEVVVQKV